MRFNRVIPIIAALAVIAGCSDKSKVDVEKIRQDVATELADMAGPEKGRYFAHEAVEVTPDGEGFDVKVTGVRLLPDQAQTMTLGTVEFHLIPKGEDQYDISDLKLPSTMTFSAPAGQAKLEYGEQRFNGVWSKSLNLFLTLDASYKSMKLIDPRGSEATIEEVTASRTNTDKGNGLWDQTTKAAAKNIRIKDVQGTMNIASVDVSGDGHGLKLAELAKLQQGFNSIFSAAAAGQQPDPKTVEELRNYQNWMADSSGRMDMAGWSFTDTSGATAFTLEHFIVEAAATGMDQPKGKVTFGFQSLGLQVPAAAADPMMASLAQFIPSKFNMGFALEDVPPAAIWGAMIDLFASMDLSQQDPAQANAAAQAFGFQLMQMLQSAGSTFRLTGWEIETPAAQLKLDGAVKPSSNSIFGATANINTEITGLDAVIQGVVDTVGEAGAAEILAMVQVLRGYSIQEAAADGRTKDSFAIDVVETGEITINGKPFDMMGAMMGSPQ
jgi:hypothetical protein